MKTEQRETTKVLINSLLDRIKADQGLSTDAALARYLKTTHMSIWRWRNAEVGTSTIILLPHALKAISAQALESA